MGGGREFVTEESSWARRRRIHAQPRRAGGYDGASSSAEGESSWTWIYVFLVFSVPTVIGSILALIQSGLQACVHDALRLF